MYKIGVDLGGTNIVAGVINDKYEIIGRGKMKTNAPRPAVEIFEDITKCVKLACEDANISIDEVESVGIGTPGSVVKETGYIEYANNLDFENVPAVELFHKFIPDVNVYLENDANCAALGEAIAGCGAGKKSFVAVTLGTGVGSGYIFDGKVMSGCNEAGGEFGHMVIKFDGEECNCGRRGCWERYAAATALVRQTKEAMLADKESLMWEMCPDLDKVNGRLAFDAKRKGDKTATEVVDKYIEYVAIGTTNIINALQPDMVCFGGGISGEGENLLAPLRKYVEKNRYTKFSKIQTEICKASIGNDAGVIGAALLDN